MDESAETDQATVLNSLRGLIETVSAGGVGTQEDQQQAPAVISESVAQLIAAALNQVSQTILSAQGSGDQQDGDASQQISTDNGAGAIMTAQDTDLAQVEIQTASGAENVESIIEIASSGRRKPICVKFPTEMRKKIIDMRKEGQKYKAIAKELGVSVSGVQKVWERFLATGLIHDRKPSTYAGRPRKFSLYSSNEEESSAAMSPLYLAAGTSEGEAEGAYTSTELSTPSRAVLVPSNDGEVFHEEPMDAPGAMVEVVASTTPTTTPSSLDVRRGGKKLTPTHDYRKTLLLKLIEDCPLAMLMGQTDSNINPHVTNIPYSVARPLYMEYVLGHPFGKVPSPKPFDGSVEESEVILSDSCNPIAKEMLASLGYSTKVHFNACCKPSPLFDPHKVLTKLPFSIGPGHLSDTIQVVLQTLIDLCLDPVAALELIPAAAVGPLVVAQTSDGDVSSRHIVTPSKLSEYWLQLYEYSSKLQCCENFFSATRPSVPCLLCHPFESFAHNLQIKDPSPPPSPSVAHESSAPPVITLNLTNSTSRTRSRKQSLDNVHRIESTSSQHNYTLLHTTPASISQASSTDDPGSGVVSTANLIPVTLVLCTDGAAKGQEVTVAQKEDGIELQCQPQEGDLGVDGIQYVAYSTAEQEQTNLETDLSGVVVVSEVEREVVVEEVPPPPPSLNTRSRRKRQSTNRSETPRAKK